MAHPVVQFGLLSYCPLCHLLQPCFDGEILARASRNGYATVAEIAAKILAGKPKRTRRSKPLQTCRKGLHPFTRANTLYEAGPGGKKIRRCLQCRTEERAERERRKGRRPHPSSTGVCRSGLHAWTDANILVDAKTGAQRCRPCRLALQREIYARNVVVRCVVGGCPGATHRPPEATGYVCKFHRRNPPEWFARAGLRIDGTTLKTA